MQQIGKKMEWHKLQVRGLCRRPRSRAYLALVESGA